MAFFFKLLLAAAFGLGVYYYYGTIMPAPVALVFACLVAMLLVWGAIAGKLSLNFLAFGGPVVATWPLGAILYRAAAGEFGFGLTWAQGLAGGWWLPMAAYAIEFAMSKERERARDLGGLVVGLILVYTVGVAVILADMPALAVASLGAAAGAIVIRQHLLISPENQQRLGLAAGAAAVAAGLAAARAVLF